MCYMIAKLVNIIQAVYDGWNLLFWNYHCDLACMHDKRLRRLDMDWRNKI